MKILFVSTCFPSPELSQYCVFLEQQAQALISLGHEVQVFHFSDEKKADTERYTYHGIAIQKGYERRKKTKLGLLYPCRTIADCDLILDSIISDGVDVVSFHFGGLNLFVSTYRICKKHGIPLIHHFHGLNIWGNYFDPHPLLTRYINIYNRKYYKKLSATINVSRKVETEFTRVIDKIPSYTVYNGVDIDRFPYNHDRVFFKDNSIRVLCVANLIPIKGQKYLIEAAEELQKHGISVKLTFAGRGSDEQMLKSLASQNKVDADFVGYIPYDEIASLMQTQDLFIMPSFYEALGCVYLEAMASGMITVGVKGQGIDEVICDGKNGFFVEPQSSQSIVDSVERILSLSEDERNKISKAGRETSEKYTWDASAKALEKVYLEVINNKGKK